MEKGFSAVSFTTDAFVIAIANPSEGLCAYLFVCQVEKRENACGVRFGTHSTENFIGLILRLYDNSDYLDGVERCTAKASIAAGIMHKLGTAIRFHIPREK
jgi:hypothetical protein